MTLGHAFLACFGCLALGAAVGVVYGSKITTDMRNDMAAARQLAVEILKAVRAKV